MISMYALSFVRIITSSYRELKSHNVSFTHFQSHNMTCFVCFIRCFVKTFLFPY